MRWWKCLYSNGHLPLHISCLHGHLNVTKYLIAELKCDPNSRGKHGFTPPKNQVPAVVTKKIEHQAGVNGG